MRIGESDSEKNFAWFNHMLATNHYFLDVIPLHAITSCTKGTASLNWHATLVLEKGSLIKLTSGIITELKMVFPDATPSTASFELAEKLEPS